MGEYKEYTMDELKQLDPTEYAKMRNAEDPDNAWRPEDPEYFKRYATAYDYELGLARSTVSDVYKDINGFRPHGYYVDMTLDEINVHLDTLFAELRELMRDAL